MDCEKYKCKRIIICIISAVIALNVAKNIGDLHPLVWDIMAGGKDIFFSLNVLIAWLSSLQLFFGIALGIVAIPLMILIIAPLLGLEIVLEKKIGLTNAVIIDAKPENSVFSIFFYSYILFGPVVIITRISSAIGEQSMFQYFLVVGEYVRGLMPIVLIFLVSPYILRDRSRIRSMKKNLTISYPSKLQEFVLVIVIGVGSVAALAPLYTELVAIVQDETLALTLFIYAVLLGIIPSIMMVIGFFIGAAIIGKPFFQISIETLEKITKKYGKIEKS